MAFIQENKTDWDAIFREAHRRFPWRAEAPPPRGMKRGHDRRKSKKTSTGNPPAGGMTSTRQGRTLTADKARGGQIMLFPGAKGEGSGGSGVQS